MCKFKVGDRVRCIHPEGSSGVLQKDRVYTVDGVSDEFVSLKECLTSLFSVIRLELAEEPSKTTPHKHTALIKAWADGAQIQASFTPYINWFDVVSPMWDNEDFILFRIKPEPKPDVIKYLSLSSSSGVYNKGTNTNTKITCCGITGELKSIEMI